MKHVVKGTYIRLVMEPVNRKLEIPFSVDIFLNFPLIIWLQKKCFSSISLHNFSPFLVNFQKGVRLRLTDYSTFTMQDALCFQYVLFSFPSQED